jgi:hypothetical protein
VSVTLGIHICNTSMLRSSEQVLIVTSVFQVLSWACMISAYVQHGHAEEALCVFGVRKWGGTKLCDICCYAVSMHVLVQAFYKIASDELVYVVHCVYGRMRLCYSNPDFLSCFH